MAKLSRLVSRLEQTIAEVNERLSRIEAQMGIEAPVEPEAAPEPTPASAQGASLSDDEIDELLAGTIGELEDAIESIEDRAVLQDLMVAEGEGQKRKGAIGAIEARLEALSEGE